MEVPGYGSWDLRGHATISCLHDEYRHTEGITAMAISVVLHVLLRMYDILAAEGLRIGILLPRNEL